MDETAVKRLCLLSALQTEVEGYKIQNQQDIVNGRSPTFGLKQFEHTADQMRALAYQHPDQF